MIKLLKPFMDNSTLLLLAMMVLVMAARNCNGHDADDSHPGPDPDPVCFGVPFIMNKAIGLITPPVGSF